ncbi:MAG: Xaa-Pro peptidase family protein [Bacillota bacterium]|nr:Xaa-Pro peptidase family protein [Bacillota bacterium]
MTRLQALRQGIAGQQIEYFLVTGNANRRYLSGFTGSSGVLLVSPERCWLVTDFRYYEQARQQAPDWELYPQKGKLSEALGELFREQGICRLGFEKDHTSYTQYETLAGLGPELVGQSGLVEKLRMTKDEGEIGAIRRAAALADDAFAHILSVIRPGVREEEVALELEYHMRRAGAAGPAFDIIVASGPRSALPHGRASSRRIEAGGFVTMDLGCAVDGYCSDLTRTVVVGRADEEQRKVYEVVARAQKAGLAALRAGRRGSEVDAEARRVIAEAGHADHFGHGLGHGVGLEVHEAPRLSPQAAGPDEPVLEPGMVVTVEPGVYIPDWGGVRIEDLVVVREEGCEILSRAEKRLIEL